MYLQRFDIYQVTESIFFENDWIINDPNISKPKNVDSRSISNVAFYLQNQLSHMMRANCKCYLYWSLTHSVFIWPYKTNWPWTERGQYYPVSWLCNLVIIKSLQIHFELKQLTWIPFHFFSWADIVYRLWNSWSTSLTLPLCHQRTQRHWMIQTCG